MKTHSSDNACSIWMCIAGSDAWRCTMHKTARLRPSWPIATLYQYCSIHVPDRRRSPGLRNPSTFSQAAVASNILETASRQSAWKAALKAWDPKLRTCRSSEALISEAQRMLRLSWSVSLYSKTVESPKRDLCLNAHFWKL